MIYVISKSLCHFEMSFSRLRNLMNRRTKPSEIPLRSSFGMTFLPFIKIQLTFQKHLFNFLQKTILLQ